MLRQNFMVVGACAVIYSTVTRKQRGIETEYSQVHSLVICFLKLRPTSEFLMSFRIEPSAGEQAHNTGAFGI